MSFSSTLYIVSEDLFQKINAGLIKPQEVAKESKAFVTIQDSSDAIQFILKKRAIKNDEFIREIFFPAENIGSVSDEEFEKLVALKNYEEIDRIATSTFYFLRPDKVAALNTFFDSLDLLEVRRLYDPDELNSNGIYPGLWTLGDSNDEAYNLAHIQNDLQALKQLFQNASIKRDYIVTFTG